MDSDKDKIIEKLEDEIDDLKSELFDFKLKQQYSKENELKEFILELYNSVDDELNKKDSKHYVDEYDKLTKEDLLKNLKSYIEEFMRNNKLFP